MRYAGAGSGTGSEPGAFRVLGEFACLGKPPVYIGIRVKAITMADSKVMLRSIDIGTTLDTCLFQHPDTSLKYN